MDWRSQQRGAALLMLSARTKERELHTQWLVAMSTLGRQQGYWS